MSADKKRKYNRKPTPSDHNLPLSDIFYTYKEVAAMFHITARALRYWVAKKIIPIVKIANGRVLFNKTDVDEMVRRYRNLGILLLGWLGEEGQLLVVSDKL